jgi:Domain of unknown function (DUF4279)
MTSKKEIATRQRRYELSIYLFIYSESRSVVEMSKLIGLQPDLIRNLGDRPRSGSAPVGANIWRMNSSAEAINSTVSIQLEALYGRIKQHIHNICNLPSDINKIAKCVVYGYDEMPEVSFMPDELQMLSEIKCKLEIAIYDLTNTT